MATTVVDMDFDAQCGAAERIFVGAVRDVESRRASANPRYFETLVTFDVGEVIAGDVPNRVELRFSGGRIGNELQAIDGMPEFQAGERYVVFVEPQGERPLVSPVVGFNQGLYRVIEKTMAGTPVRVVRDRQARALSAAASAAVEAAQATGSVSVRVRTPTAVGAGEIDLGSFVAAIRAARAR